jgi:hypothetical protein
MSKQSRRNRKPQGTARAPQKANRATAPARPTATPTSRDASPAETDRATARAERRKEQQERAQRQKMIRTVASVAVVAVVLLGVWGAWRLWAGPDVSAEVVTYFDVNNGNAVHPEDDIVILYEQIPPVGGPHNAVWQTCGFYDEYIYNWHGVHSMEHGAVWITYDPGLPQDQIDTLKGKADQGFVLVSPYPGMDAPVVASVWGKQMTFTGADDDRLDSFIRQYRVNPDNTPELGATCLGGATFTTEEVPQQNPYVQANPDATPIGGLTSIDATATAEAVPSSPEGTPAARTAEDEGAR